MRPRQEANPFGVASCRERDRLRELCGLTTLFTPPRRYGHLSSPARQTPKQGRFKSGGEGSASAAPAHQSPMTPGPRHRRLHRSEFQHARAVCSLGWNDNTPARKRLHRRAAPPGLCQEANRPVACGWPIDGNPAFGVPTAWAPDLGGRAASSGDSVMRREPYDGSGGSGKEEGDVSPPLHPSPPAVIPDEARSRDRGSCRRGCTPKNEGEPSRRCRHRPCFEPVSPHPCFKTPNPYRA